MCAIVDTSRHFACMPACVHVGTHVYVCAPSLRMHACRAPEIFEEVPYSFKSDVWALGCVMYEMLTGKPAFAADSLSRVVLRVIRGSYDPMPETYSPALRSVITAMLCRDVRNRPSAADLLVHPSVVPYVQVRLVGCAAACMSTGVQAAPIPRMRTRTWLR